MTINIHAVREDLYLAVNGDRLEAMEIPADKAAAGGFSDLRDQMEDLMMEDLAAMAAGEIPAEDPALEDFKAYYQLAHDFQRRDQEGHQPLQTYLDRVLALEELEDVQALVKDWILNRFPLPFAFRVSPDQKNTDQYVLYLDPGPSILPDRSYYEPDHPHRERLLSSYRDMSIQLLEALGVDGAFDYVDRALAFDSRLAPRLKSREEVMADYSKLYNPRDLETVQGYSDFIDFGQIIQDLLGQPAEALVVSQPDYFQDFNQLVQPDSFQDLKAWLLVQLVNTASQALSEDLRQLGSQYQLALSGNPETQSPAKHAYYLAKAPYDQVIGVYYGKKYFGPQARADVRDMVETMVAVFKGRLEGNSWLSGPTIQKAIEKLAAMEYLIGYPDTYPQVYAQLSVDKSETFFENRQRLIRIFEADQFSRWHQAVDRGEWHMPADMVNAYFSPLANVICFPAAILQAPFYSLDQSRSENYGGIGAVIAHEITHAFDNNGAKYDAKGNINDWWQEADRQAFQAKADEMVQIWDGIEIHGGKVNGRLTVSENIADLGGLTAALEACKLEADADVPAFFMNWARIWCQKGRPEYLQMLLQIDVHSPNPLRANMPSRMLDAFYTAFGVTESDPMYLDPDQRLVIW